jgi:serine/threonine protein kinase
MRGTRWVVRGALGQGGSGYVLDVEKEGVIQGAMKVLYPHFAKMPVFAARFLEEVRVTARLQHVNIVQVLDFDRLEDGTPFMVMERLHGRTLGAAIREARRAGRSFTAANTYAVALQVAEGLYRAHSHVPSIVHRDIKPDNLYLHRPETSFESVVKVMDFGVAAAVGEEVQVGIGTPKYMAPEQVAGEPLSPQTDQYALALVIYLMLTGRLPWEVDSCRDAADLAEVRRRVPPARPSQFCPWLPAPIEAALLKGLSKDPAARHDTVHGLMFGLRGLQSVSDRWADTDDTHSTVPTVGTLAEAGSIARDDAKTVEWMTVPPDEGRALELFEPSGGMDISQQITRREGPAPAGSPSLDPLTGASRPEDLARREGRSRRGVSTRVLALVASAAVLMALAGAAVATSSSGPGKKAVAEVGSPPAAVPSLTLGEPVTAAPAQQSRGDAIDARDAAAELVVPAWLAAHEPTVAAAPGAQPEAGPAATAVRKAPAPRPRPSVRTAPVKAPVPDDGRDELILPEAR